MVNDIGDVVALAVTIRDSDGDPADATAITCTITLPDGTAYAAPVAKTGVGTYTVSYTPTMAGLHTVRWVATGANASAYRDSFTVSDTLPPLVSLADVREWLRKADGDRASDEELRTVLDSATSLAESYTGRALRPRGWTGTIAATRTGILVLPEPAATSITGVTTVDGVDLTALVEMDHPAAGQYLRRTDGRDLIGRHAVTVRLGVTGRVLDIAQAGVRELVRHMWEPKRGGAPLPLQAAASMAARPAAAHALPWLVTEQLDQIVLSS